MEIISLSNFLFCCFVITKVKYFRPNSMDKEISSNLDFLTIDVDKLDRCKFI
jgi:hypothetical protein